MRARSRRLGVLSVAGASSEVSLQLFLRSLDIRGLVCFCSLLFFVLVVVYGNRWRWCFCVIYL